MPSGAKKRKAAKKKKELEANTTNIPIDNDDAKSQDDKGSDGGEIYSPAHQDHHNNHHPFNEGDPSGDRSIAFENNKTMENTPSGGEEEHKAGFLESIVDKIEQRLKSESDDDGKSSSSSSSSHSSSDDESRAADKKQGKEAVEVDENESKGTDNLIAELSPVIGSIKPVVPVSEETISVVEVALVDNLLVSEVIKSEVCAQEPSSAVPETVAGYSPKKYDDDMVIPITDDNSKASPSEFKSDSKGHEEKELPPSDVYVAQPSSDTDLPKGSKIPEHSGNQPPVAPAEGPVKKTSVFGCCGIFELFSGSSR